jgi:hypothetical protein
VKGDRDLGRGGDQALEASRGKPPCHKPGFGDNRSRPRFVQIERHLADDRATVDSGDAYPVLVACFDLDCGATSWRKKISFDGCLAE